MQNSHARIASIVALIVTSASAPSCGAGLNQTSITCSEGRTLLDGVCVSEQVADYVSCVRAQGAQLGAEKGQKISAEVGYLGAKAGGAAELNETLQKKYSASDTAMLAIIQACSGASALAANGTGGADKAPSKKLAAHWAFDEAGGMGAADASGNGNTATGQGTITWAPGRVGGAAKLDGSSRFDVPDGASQHSPRAITMSAWFLLTEKEIGHPWRGVFHKGNKKNGDIGGCGPAGGDMGPSPCDEREYGIGVNSAERFVHVFAVTEDRYKTSGQLVCNTPPGSVQFGKWHHVAAVIASQSRAVRVLIDGVPMATCPMSEAGLRRTSEVFLLGAGWTGMLDDLRIYADELTDAEIAALAKAK